jgi:hypothetical protein
MRWSIAAGVTWLMVAWLGGSASASGGASLSVRLVPEHPAVGSSATLELDGSTAQTGIPLVLAVTGSGCPARIPTSAHVLVPKTGVVTGGISGSVRVRIDAATTRFCVFLVPAKQNAYGVTRYVKTALPLDAVEVELAGEPRLDGGGVIFGHTRTDNSTVALWIARSGTRITKLVVTCGGSPLHPPAIGQVFIGKRFVANVSLPLASKLRWSGPLRPDNSSNYDKPIPAQWNGAVRYTLDAQLVIDPIGGQPQIITGTGRLGGPGLPCPTERRYVRS